jgi:hypothetical protein
MLNILKTLKTPKTLPIRTRLPLAAWAVAALVTLFSLMSSLVHAPLVSGHAVPVAEQATQPGNASHQARL